MMKHDYASIGLTGSGALALALLVAGCGGNTGVGPVPGGQSLAPAGVQTGRGDSSDMTSPDRRHHHRACAKVTNSQNFNGTAIAKGSYIWFSSVEQLGGGQSAAKVEMRDSRIRFTDGTRSYEVKGPNMRLDIGKADVKLHWQRFDKIFRGREGRFLMKAPSKTAGNDLLNGIAYKVPRDLAGGIKNVTWSARFYSKNSGVQFHWQWGAAVYTKFNRNYNRVDVKPLDDNHYPPYNSDHAGTPEAYKNYVTGGATGGGGANYTGGLGPSINVTPCK
ncbi:MAG TPA: hypothetical protein VKR56_09350 [Candidatus Cybelea sp.]|nr:hypothetical protein [Candidatus Cybelea sp.]